MIESNGYLQPQMNLMTALTAMLSPGLSRYLTGPINLKDPEAKIRFPKIFVSAEDGYEELHLIVYKVSWSKYFLLFRVGLPISSLIHSHKGGFVIFR